MSLVKIEQAVVDMPLPRDPAKPVTVILEFPPLYWVRNSRKRIGEGVLRRGDPFWDDPVLALDFGSGDTSGHSEPPVVTRPSVSEEKVCGLVIGVDSDLAAFPSGSPKASGDHVGQQFQVGDTQFPEVFWCRRRKVLVIVMIIRPEARCSAVKTIG